jgi:glycosyltransferase involved in cell wall biosynthesis
MSFLIVTPARDEAARLPSLAASLQAQREGTVGHWVIVDDGSTDGTADCLPDLPFPVTVVRRDNSGGLGGGSAFAAWRFGVERGLGLLPQPERIMKLDADLVLDEGHLAALEGRPESLIAGVVRGPREVHRSDYTRGPLKAYTLSAYGIVRELPAAVGFDVMDEVALRAAGFTVAVVPEARATVTRLTGSSEGLLRGRYRGGIVSRWTGYAPLYFILRLVRHLVRKPVGVGSVAMLLGYIRAGRGPWPAGLKRALRAEQHARLRAMIRAPRRHLAGYRRVS